MREQIERIENKVQQLLKEYSNAQKEIHRLQKENDHLTKQLQAQTVQADLLIQIFDSITLSGTQMEDKARKDLEKRINTYLKDIDKCLALLHS